MSRGDVRGFLSLGIQCARTVSFRLMPPYSSSSARICDVVISDRGVAKVSSNFILDSKNVAGILQKLHQDQTPMTYIVEGNFSRRRTEVIQVGHDE